MNKSSLKSFCQILSLPDNAIALFMGGLAATEVALVFATASNPIFYLTVLVPAGTMALYRARFSTTGPVYYTREGVRTVYFPVASYACACKQNLDATFNLYAGYCFGGLFAPPATKQGRFVSIGFRLPKGRWPNFSLVDPTTKLKVVDVGTFMAGIRAYSRGHELEVLNSLHPDLAETLKMQILLEGPVTR